MLKQTSIIVFHRSKKAWFGIKPLLLLTTLIFFGLAVRPAAASGDLTIEPLTWNIIGLDSNNVNTGPQHFPIGARVCNQSGGPLSDVLATYHWDDGNDKYNGHPFINLRPGTLDQLTLNLAAGECKDAYFEATVTRNASAYRQTRSYYITAESGAASISTPRPRELYVERLISQNRNVVNDMQWSTNGVDFSSIASGGSMTLMVGQTYFIKLVGKTATQGYEQLESFINFPNTIFQVLSVDTTYSADSSATVNPPYDKLYADGCVWENNPLSPNYRSCLSTGKLGGSVTVTYELKILQVPGAPLVNPEPLGTLIYDFSGASYHYNSDFGVSTRFANVVNASIGKSFSPKVILPGANSTLTFTINNPGPEPISDVNFTDNLPAGMSVNSTNITYNNCGSPSPASLTVGATSLSLSNITVPGLGNCTIGVTVTANDDGGYNNQSDPLYIGSENTGSSAQDTLTVSSLPPPPTSCDPGQRVTMATWTMPTSGQGSGGPPPPFTTRAANVSTATASAALTGVSGSTQVIATDAGNPVNSWRIRDAWKNTVGAPTPDAAPYFQFLLDTSNYGAVQISFQYRLMANNEWAANNNAIHVYSSPDGGTPALIYSQDATKGDNWYSVPATTAATSGSSTTWFRISATTRAGQAPLANVGLDNIIFTGCPRPTLPTLSKSFSPTSIPQGDSAALTFNFGNPNSGNLSGINFSDTLPAGLVVANPNGLSAITCTSGSVVTAPTRTAVPGTSTISMSGLTLSGNASCSFSVNVTGQASGQYTNISSAISSPATGPNTGPTGFGVSNLTVVAPPIMGKAFGTTNLIVGESITLTFSILNPNPTTALTGVAFSDSLPTGLTVADPNGLVGNCGGGTITADSGTNVISLSNATLAGGESCTFSVQVSGNATGEKANSVQVISTNGGSGNTAEATMLVRELMPALTLAKKVSDSPTGPWRDSLIIPPGTDVYYQFIVENMGDAPLSDITIDDPDINTTTCSWPNPLPVANDQGEEIAICVVGPFTAGSGQIPNTATASGSYDSVVYDSEPNSATYLNGNFGNLPNQYTYMNLYNDGGAMHLNCPIGAPVRLGDLVETGASDGSNEPEANWQPRSSADGVVWTPGFGWTVGEVANDAGGSADVTFTCPDGQTCYLYAWFDWNQDGAFDGDGEALTLYLDGSPTHAFQGTGTAETVTLRFDIPDGTPFDSSYLYARFRIYADEPADPRPNGLAVDANGDGLCGEIEDHRLQITPTAVTLQTFATIPTNQISLPLLGIMLLLMLTGLVLVRTRLQKSLRLL